MVVSIDTNSDKVDLKGLLIDMKAARDKACLQIDEMQLPSRYKGYDALRQERDNLGLLIEALEPVVEKWEE
jgi:hypothetical protein